MSALRRGDYRDPAVIIEQREARTCAGCGLLGTQEWLGTRKFVCRLGKQKSSKEVMEMLRCRSYSETGRSIVGIKEKIVGAAQSKDLAWHAEFVKAIDRLTALGMSDPLGAALWRFKYLNDAAAYNRALYLLVKKSRDRLRALELDYLINMARGVLQEWALDACGRCHGAGRIVEGNGVSVKCGKCDGSGLKRYADHERERNCRLPHGAWNAGHNRTFDAISVCLAGATAATSGKIRDLLKNQAEVL